MRDRKSSLMLPNGIQFSRVAYQAPFRTLILEKSVTCPSVWAHNEPKSAKIAVKSDELGQPPSPSPSLY
jgi:hypothetical protein